MTNADAKQDPHRPLEPGQEWHIGGQDRQMEEKEQLEQLVAYIDAHYDTPDFRPPWAGGGSPEADQYCALLPDRITPCGNDGAWYCGGSCAARYCVHGRH